jgi:hypothetical protein
VLYECLTGRVPFEKDLNEAIMWAHMEEHPTRPTLLRPDLPPEVDEMFARVLAKQPGDRYENCREFMAAARDALGPMAAGASANRSLRALRPAPPLADRQEVAHDRGAGLRDLTASVERPGPPPMENLPYAKALPDPGTADPDEALHPTGTPRPEWAVPYLPDGPGSGSLPPGETGPPDPGSGWPRHRRSRISMLLLAVAFVLAVGIGITIGAWTGSSGLGSGRQPGASASAGASSTGAALTPPMLSSTSTKTLQQALAAMNVTVWTTGYLPPKSCTFLSAAYAQCSRPYPGITEAVFQNYSSPDALYKAYETAIKQANNGHFPVNEQDCGSSAPPSDGAEISWNHLGLHTRAYSIAQLETGKLNASSQAAGRVFCNYNSSTSTEDIIWTQTDGNMLGEVTGSPHLAIWSWWLHIHHNIAFNGQPMGAMDTTAPDPFPKA